MTPLCMTVSELALWREAAERADPDPRKRATVPCVDCPANWRHDQDALGRCNGDERIIGRPRIAIHSERRRLMWREKSRVYRSRRAAA